MRERQTTMDSIPTNPRSGWSRFAIAALVATALLTASCAKDDPAADSATPVVETVPTVPAATPTLPTIPPSTDVPPVTDLSTTPPATDIEMTPLPTNVDAAVTGHLESLVIRSVGGFVPWAYSVRELPMVTVADGQVITTGPMIEIYPQPALPNVRTRPITDAGLAQITAMLNASGLLVDNIDFGFPNVADVPSTDLVVTIDGKTTSISAMALGMDDPILTKEQREARATFNALINRLTSAEPASADTLGPDTPFVATAYQLWSQKVTSPPDTAADAIQPKISDWSIPEVTFDEGNPCVAVDGDVAGRVATLFRSETVISQFRQNGSRWNVIARPLLPNETGCPKTN